MAAEMKVWIEETERAEMTIGPMALRASVALSAISYYEEIELLPPARVNGRRRYN